MKKTNPFAVGFCIISMNTLSQSKNEIIINYEPVQSAFVGKTLTTINGNGQALFVTKIPDLITKDEISSAYHVKEFNKRLALGSQNNQILHYSPISATRNGNLVINHNQLFHHNQTKLSYESI